MTAERAQKRRVLTVALTDDYEGWVAEIDGNFTVGQVRALNSGRVDRVCEAISESVISWNFVDKGGAELEVGDVDNLTLDLLSNFTSAITEALKLPN